MNSTKHSLIRSVFVVSICPLLFLTSCSKKSVQLPETGKTIGRSTNWKVTVSSVKKTPKRPWIDHPLSKIDHVDVIFDVEFVGSSGKIAIPIPALTDDRGRTFESLGMSVAAPEGTDANGATESAVNKQPPKQFLACFAVEQKPCDIQTGDKASLSYFFEDPKDYGKLLLSFGDVPPIHLITPQDEKYSVAFSPDGKLIASGSTAHTAILWDVSTGAELRILKGHSDWVTSVAFSPSGKTLATGSRDKTVKLWDVASGAELRTLNGHSHGVNPVVFSPDGKTLASASSEDETVKLWNVENGEELRTINGHPGSLVSVVFSPDGRTLVTGSPVKIKMWDVATGAELRTLEGHSDMVESLAFSPDGRTLASGSLDKSIKLWDVSTGAELRTLKGYSGKVYSIAFSPDGRTLASGSTDGKIKLWDVLNGSELRTLSGYFGYTNSVAFSPDGKTLAGGSSDNMVKIWDAATGEVLRSFIQS